MSERERPITNAWGVPCPPMLADVDPRYFDPDAVHTHPEPEIEAEIIIWQTGCGPEIAATLRASATRKRWERARDDGALHPAGRCRCAQAGSCEWCQMDKRRARDDLPCDSCGEHEHQLSPGGVGCSWRCTACGRAWEPDHG